MSKPKSLKDSYSMEMQKKFVAEVKHKMVDMDIDVKQLSIKSGISAVYLYQLFALSRGMSFKHVERICSALNMNFVVSLTQIRGTENG